MAKLTISGRQYQVFGAVEGSDGRSVRMRVTAADPLVEELISQVFEGAPL